ncbi:MAG: hypothetical protein PHX44_01710 [Sulfurimonas sp.]|uniref:hypothetical protein n=1 Tax=Sulfurimonas sp. TaxID=2022749 RepID=UPI00262D47D9|nr:hypothetical protein [Sulfurimonas sp.]MDD2651734.1 hypothetical protein [Sulfurimonas sp.]MDD2651751.1 hypothetical protein [Sulfurimonas sp.]MDD3451697.1 hypothetical protein [Sulfurimonas sp.]MDD3451714.1 hypothetical protein [Sulfurimonas sp.]
MVKIISQHVDTLKEHYYISSDIDDADFKKYLGTVDDLIYLKKQSQERANEYNSDKVIVNFGVHKFEVLPTSISGFSVVLVNNDITIALRKTKNKINSSPLMKVEYRAEFLARYGYVKCISIVNNFVKIHLLSSYLLKIPEIHLACDIQGYNFTHLDFYRLRTRARLAQTHEDVSEFAKASVYGGITSFSGFTFGGGDYHLRVYNKSLEIDKKKEKSFVKSYLWQNCLDYDENKTVWRIEIQFRREKLKKLKNADSYNFDDYLTVLNNIPALFDKALTDFKLLDLDEKTVFNLLRGKRTLRDGTEKLLTKYAMQKIYQRANVLDFWEDMKVWNGYRMSGVSTSFKVPQKGSLDYVSNSIKSLFSTMSKYYGSISQDTLIQAFKDSNSKNYQDKEISLLEDCINKQLDWFEKIDYCRFNGVVSVPDYQDLERSIYTTVYKASDSVYDVLYSPELVEKLDSRALFHNKGGVSI